MVTAAMKLKDPYSLDEKLQPAETENLKEMGIPEHLTCLLRNLYAGEEATLRTGHVPDWFQIGKGVRQGCIVTLLT